MFLGDSMRPSPCTDADDLLRCRATIGNRRVGRARHPNLGRTYEIAQSINIKKRGLKKKPDYRNAVGFLQAAREAVKTK